MERSRIVARNQQGTALVIVILIMLALTGIILGVSSLSVNETQLATNEMLDKQVFYLAEAGVEQSIRYLSQLSAPFIGSGPNRDEPFLLYDNSPIYGKGTFTSYLDPLDTNTGNPTRFVNITVRATMNGNGMSKVLQVQVGQQNFSRYAYFSDLEKNPSGTTIWFHTEDVFHGPVHTNDQMHIYGAPTFYEEASSGASSVDYYHGGPPQDDPQFLKGLTLDASPIPLPNDTQMLLNKANEPGGLKLTGNPVTIGFRVDGSGNPYLRVTIGGTTTDMSYPSNGVVYVQGSAQVDGTVRGQLTVGSSGDIEIMDNIVYYTDPRVDPTSTDILGLVSDGDVFMDGYKYGANYDSADETVMAAIMALNTSWTVENYDSGPPRGKLIVYGGIIQRRRGPVGTFNSSTGNVVSGYEKDYHYDLRLMDNPPPAFPTTGQVEKIAWSEIDPATDITRNFW